MTRRCTSVRLALLGALSVRVVLKGFLRSLHLPPFLVESFAARRPAPQGKPLLDPSHSWKVDGPCIAPFHASTVLSAAAKVRQDQPPKSCFSKCCTLGSEVKTQSTVGLDPLNRRLARLTSRGIRWALGYVRDRCVYTTHHRNYYNHHCYHHHCHHRHNHNHKPSFVVAVVITVVEKNPWQGFKIMKAAIASSSNLCHFQSDDKFGTSSSQPCKCSKHRSTEA